MKYLHAIVFKVRGVVVPAEAADIELVVDSSRDILVVLTNRPDALCGECDRGTAIANLLLTHIFIRHTPMDLAKPDESNEVIATEVEKVRETRKADFGEGPCIVIKIEGQVADFVSESETEHRDFIIGLEGSPKAMIQQTSKPVITAVLTAITIAHEQIISVKKVSERVVFFRADGKPVYNYEFRSHGSGHAATPMTPSAVESTGKWYLKLLTNPSLETVSRLLTGTSHNACRNFCHLFC
jgi:hypothetical protein